VKKRTIVAWSLWDWGSAAFQAVVTTFVFTVYLTSAPFGEEAEVSTKLGMALLIAGIVVALVAPVLGRLTDAAGRRKTWLGINTAIVVGANALMVLVAPAEQYLLLGLVLLAIGNVAFEFASVSYNAMLSQVSNNGNVGKVSGFGWGMGYLGGIVLLAILLVGFIFPEVGWFGVTSEGAWNIRVAMVISALWFGIFAIPVFFAVPEIPADPRAPSTRRGLLTGYRDLFRSIADLWRTARHTLYFLIASAVFRDGLAGVFTFGGVLAQGTFGFTFGEVVIFGVAANVVAGVATMLFGLVDDRVGPKAVIVFSLTCLVLLGSGVFLLHDGGKPVFWALGLAMCLFVGPAQSASRSFLARLIPDGMSGELFGLYATTGRAVSFLSPTLFGLTIGLGALVTTGGSTQHWGILGVVAVLLVGLIVALFVKDPTRA
jgi:UMF1 family MFS transporter